MKLPSDKVKVSFVFEGINYVGYLVCSTDILPHFYWFVFEDAAVIATYGDSIAFKLEEGELIPVYHLTSPLFVNAVKECVQKCIDEKERKEN